MTLLRRSVTAHRPGRFLEIGPVEIQTGTYSDRHVLFDPIGSANYADCTYLPDAVLEAMEERDEPGWWKPENWLAPGSKSPVYGGSIDFNLRGYRIGVTVWWRWAYLLCMWMNRVLSAREERKAGLA